MLYIITNGCELCTHRDCIKYSILYTNEQFLGANYTVIILHLFPNCISRQL